MESDTDRIVDNLNQENMINNYITWNYLTVRNLFLNVNYKPST